MCIAGIIAVVLVCSGCSQDKGKDILGEYSNFNGDAIVLIEANGSIKLSSEHGRYSGKYKRDGAEILVSSSGNQIAHLYVNHDQSLYGKMFGVEVRLMKVKK
jgi:hypothetical protein